jgi:hypothetical protein
MSNLIWEVGGDYHYQDIKEDNYIPWPKDSIFTATGRMPIVLLNNTFFKGRVLHIPNYFCEDVVDFWLENEVVIKRYNVDPINSRPEIGLIDAVDGDMVLAVNFYGLGEPEFWNHWKQENQGVFLVEDHTHDPFSDWAINSNADFAFSSLRKTLPIADGGILWSPIGVSFDCLVLPKINYAASLKLAAMHLKKRYLDFGSPEIKSLYRSLQILGESELSRQDVSGISDESMRVLSKGYPLVYRERSIDNSRVFSELIKKDFAKYILKNPISSGAGSFGMVLIFEDQLLRDKIRNKFITNNIYTPIHWPIHKSNDEFSIDFSSKILTIPLDFRYSIADVALVADIFNAM